MKRFQSFRTWVVIAIIVTSVSVGAVVNANKDEENKSKFQVPAEEEHLGEFISKVDSSIKDEYNTFDLEAIFKDISNQDEFSHEYYFNDNVHITVEKTEYAKIKTAVFQNIQSELLETRENKYNVSERLEP